MLSTQITTFKGILVEKTADISHFDFHISLLKNKTAQTLMCFVVLAVAPYWVPGMQRMRGLVPAGVVNGFKPSHHTSRPLAAPQAPQEILQAQEVVKTYDEPEKKASTTVDKKIARPGTQTRPGEIEDPSGHALDHFFQALNESETKGGVVHVCHYGDSPITNDGITSTVRRRLQQRFGDAGHGFILADKPWGWYGHIGVTHHAGDGWKSSPMFISGGDHRFGLGGASFTTRTAGVTASFGTSNDAEVGHSVSVFDIYFLAQPGGGDFDAEIDGVKLERVSTAGEEIHSGFHQVKVAEGPHQLTIRTVGNGEVRLFGVVLESGVRGIEYDSLGVNGAYIGLLSHYMDADHWIEQLRRRQPDLVVINYGTNESEFENLPMRQYEQDTKEVIRRIRAALPEVSILFVSPMDRGKRGEGGEIITRPMIPRLVEAQRRLAAETGCAFFDTFTAMGGEGTVAEWVTAHPKLMGGDYTHPTWQGSEIVGTLISDAILRAYESSRQ